MSRGAVRASLLAAVLASIAGGVVGGPTPEEALATGRGGGSPATTGPAIEARAWTLIDARTGRVLDSHAAAMHLPIASTTKLMTAYVALQELPLGQDRARGALPPDLRRVAAQPAGRAGGQRPRPPLRPDPAQRQRRRLRPRPRRGRLGGGVRPADEPARRRARPRRHPLRQPDRARPARQLLERRATSRPWPSTCSAIPVFAKIADSTAARLRSLRPPRRITTINELLHLAPWVNGVKTGHTFDAGYVLVGSGRRKGVELISVVIGAPTDEARYAESLELLERGFAQYRKRVPIRAGRTSPTRRSATPAASCRCGRPHSVAAGVDRGQRLERRGRRARGGRGADRARRGPRPGHGPRRRPARRARPRCGPVARSPRPSLFDRVRSFVSEHTILTAVALFVILIGAVLLWRSPQAPEGDGEIRERDGRRSRRSDPHSHP